MKKSQPRSGALRAVLKSEKKKPSDIIQQEDAKQPFVSPSWSTAPVMNVYTTIRNGHLLVVSYGPDGIPRLLHKRKLRLWL